MMGVNSPHYVGSNWPGNEGSYNWDVGLLCSWDAGLSPSFNHWGNAGCGSWASHLDAMVTSLKFCVELRVWDVGFKLYAETRASSLSRRGLWALHLGIVVMLGRGFRASRFDTVVMLRRGFRALRFDIAVVLRRGLRALRLGIAVNDFN